MAESRSDDLKTILVVEDNPEFSAAAMRFYDEKKDKYGPWNMTFVHEFGWAMEILNANRFDGALIDCFFPKHPGSEDRSEGYAAIEKMVASDPSGRRNDPVARAIKQVGDTISLEFAEQAAKDAGKSLRDADPYWLLGKKIEQDPANQPLGILVAERARELGIPFVLATSTYHHDEMTQPIQDYCFRVGYTLVDCSPGDKFTKDTPEFWERAYRDLESKIHGSRE